MTNDFLDSARKQFEYYKMLGDKTFSQVQDDKLFWQYNDDSNSMSRPEIGLHELTCKRDEKIRKNSSGTRGYHSRVFAG